ncbi:hypothetical protein CTRI78_v011864 [Colletotrichum trifolii]|uniref:Fungal N-terminal domain-containing protein n=1 Tax=Colletotrichum trifolii TaxID=5466 RepID=A0A4R8Q1P0_COLTR|nr:hypothetical protein CTRI78_v011864 [Colletotrichum trifolii]
MDPVSIITGAASLAGVVLTASLKIKDVLDRVENAPQNVSDIAEEIYAVQYALSQVEDVVRRDPNVIDRLALEDVFALAVKGCHATLLCIHNEYEQLFERKDWKTKILVLWKDGEMTRLLGRLDRKKATLSLLTQTLNLRSTQDIKELLVQNQSTLAAARQDSTESVPVYPPRAAKTKEMTENDTVNDSVYGDNESVLSTTEFSFDYDLINTRTYRMALARAQAASRRRQASAVDVDKPLPLPAGPNSPASLAPLKEEQLTPVQQVVDMSGDTADHETLLSRATTLLPETASNHHSGGSWTRVLSVRKVSSPTNEKLRDSNPFFTPAVISTMSAEPEQESIAGHTVQQKPEKHKLRSHQTKDKKERLPPHPRRAREKEIQQDLSATAPSRNGSSQSPPGHEEKALELERGSSTVSEGATGTGKHDKSRHRHRCGRRPDLRSRHAMLSQLGKDGEGGEICDLLLPRPGRARHGKGIPTPAEALADAVRQLTLSEPPSLRRGRGPRKQTV